MWLIGASTALSGVILYIELGLTVPRYRLGDSKESKEKTPVLRSGGELPYVRTNNPGKSRVILTIQFLAQLLLQTS
jgi:hypothetical protein